MQLRLEPGIPALQRRTALLTAGCGLALLVLARFFPWSSVPAFCSFRNFTGYPCPGCGMTRSWVHMIHGRTLEALTINPFGSLLFVFLILGLLYLGLRSFFGIPALRLSMSSRGRIILWVSIGAALAANWAYTWTTGVAL